MKGKGKASASSKEKKDSKASAAETARWGLNLEDTVEQDDWSSAWQEVLEGKGVWGGRTRGGRGVQRITGFTRDISVEGITLSFSGKELLQRTSLKFVHGHRYGIIGENGVGKSTLLRRLAKQSIPGVPLHFRFGYVQQEIPVIDNVTVLDYILRGVASMESLESMLENLKEDEAGLEALLEKETDSDKLSELAEELCLLSEKIEDMEAKIAQQRAEASDNEKSGRTELTRAYLESLGKHTLPILDGLGLSKPIRRLSAPFSELSGGWRMRAALAHCLCNLDSIDVLLLDEPTNHLDIPTVAWLQSFLADTSVIIVFVSHDRSFLSTVSTDIIEMKDLGLHYFNGNYEDFLRNKQEMATRTAHAIDARARREAHLQKSIDQAQQRGDDRTMRTKQKKLERAAFTQNIDGHRFKLFSLKTLDEDAVQMPEIIDAERARDFRAVKFKFPAVDASALRLSAPNAPLLTFDRVTLSYATRPADQPVLTNVTCQVTLRSRIGIIGRNGRGKTTLLQALVHGANGTYGDEAVRRKKAASGSGLTVFRSDGAAAAAVPATPAAAPKTTAAPVAGAANAEATRKKSPVQAARVNRHDVQIVRGTVWRHHNLRVGVVAQHQIDLLSHYLQETPVSYLKMILTGQIAMNESPSAAGDGAATPAPLDPAASAAASEASRDQEIRALLGSCGLSGRVPLQPIGSLSGGQKARLSFAAVCALRPHILCLDEPSNHLSLEAIEALIHALQDYAGGIMLISHNAHLVSHVCRELWLVKGDGVVSVRRPAIEHLQTAAEASTGGSGGDAADGAESLEAKIHAAMRDLLQECIAEQMQG